MDTAYKGRPLANVSACARGVIIQKIARRVDCILHPEARVLNAQITPRVDGAHRSANQTEYDWLRDDIRIECKSAQLRWDTSNKCWKCVFSGIKASRSGLVCQNAFDELFLALYSPLGIHFFRHNVAWEARGGQLEHRIRIYARRRDVSWPAALDTVLDKLEVKTFGLVASILW